MAHRDDPKEIINVNVGGKRYTVRRGDLIVDSGSKLAEWFKPGVVKPIPMDRAGNYYLDRDAKTFRYILGYLRLKKEKFVPSLALPSKPDALARHPPNEIICFMLVGECGALNLTELKDMAMSMLRKYQQNEEKHFVSCYVQSAIRDFELWQLEQEQAVGDGLAGSATVHDYDEWANMPVPAAPTE
uniref:Potassium channel tetramerisation-type BTB domain-containing protein n=1 Tax=Parascaris univalens TaxID=6257 RepID=A0A915BKN6_PARUN